MALRLPEPMLAQPGALPQGRGWVFEPKMDGFRCMVCTHDGLRARSRRGWDMSERLPELAAALPSGVQLDGELVALDQLSSVKTVAGTAGARPTPLRGWDSSMGLPGRTGRRGLADVVAERTRRAVARRRIFPYLVGVTASLALVAGFVVTLVDREDFPTFGTGLWWAIVTLGTVGYGDVVPHTTWGRVIGSVVILIGVTFISFLTAIVTSFFVSADQAEAEERENERLEALLEATGSLREATDSLREIEQRLATIESKLSD